MKYFILAADGLRIRLWLLVVLCAEFVIMISCASICFGELTMQALKNRMYDKGDYSEFYYVGVSTEEDKNTEVDRILSEMDCELMLFNGFQSPNSEMVAIYSKSAFEEIGIELEKGEEIDTDHDYGDVVPCYISSDLLRKYKVGKVYDVPDMGKILISGVVKNDIFFSYTYAGFSYSKKTIVAYDPKGLLNAVDASTFKMIDTANIADFEEKYQTYIENLYFQPYDYFYECHLELEKEKIFPFLALAITFFALSLAGLLSYSVISSREAKRQNGLFFLCGARLWEVMLITLTRVFIITVFPAILSAPIILYIKNNTYVGELTLITAENYLTAVGICLCILALSMLIVIFKTNRKSLISVVNDF